MGYVKILQKSVGQCELNYSWKTKRKILTIRTYSKNRNVCWHVWHWWIVTSSINEKQLIQKERVCGLNERTSESSLCIFIVLSFTFPCFFAYRKNRLKIMTRVWSWKYERCGSNHYACIIMTWSVSSRALLRGRIMALPMFFLCYYVFHVNAFPQKLIGEYRCDVNLISGLDVRERKTGWK